MKLSCKVNCLMSDTETYVIDRFEDNNLVVLENHQGESLILPKWLVPLNAKEGDTCILKVEQRDELSRCTVLRDAQATEVRKQALKALRDSLVKAPEGDISL